MHPVPVDAEIERMILSLGAIGAHSGTGVCRVAYSDEWVAAQDLIANWAEDAGLEVRRDAVGNLWARSEDHGEGDAVVSGSHIDSQRSGGRYDGALGVIAALVAVASLKKAYGAPLRPLEVVSLCEEEGSRFPNAGFWGSRAIVGKANEADCAKVKDTDGTPIGEVMAKLGYNPARIGTARRDDIAAFIELHIEQGPILEDADRPVAIVEAITHIRQTKVTLTGTANHAGAFPMDIRADPMAGFAEVTASLIQHADALGRPAVTTIGTCEVTPNAPAIIPASVTFTIDARHPVPVEAARLYATHDRIITEIAAKRGLRAETKVMIDLPGCLSDPALLDALQKSADEADVPTVRMASGAGHDTQQMSEICPVAMIFVRSKNGRSHTPEEFSSIADITQGIRVLTGALNRLAYQTE